MEVTVSYNNSTIANTFNIGQKTLKTENRVCTHDIIISCSDWIRPIKDGITRIYLDIPVDCDVSQITIPLYWSQSTSHGVIVNWGDESPTFTVSGTGYVYAPTPHSYSQGGKYIITMTRADNCEIGLGRDGSEAEGLLSTYTAQRMLAGIETGDGVTTILPSCFDMCYRVKKIILGKDITTIENSGFYGAYTVGSIHFLGTLPSDSNISASSVWATLPSYCKIYVPAAYIDSNNQPQNIPSRMPSTSTYTYAVEPNAYTE